MIVGELIGKQLCSVACPKCGVPPGQRCLLHSGGLRTDPTQKDSSLPSRLKSVNGSRVAQHLSNDLVPELTKPCNFMPTHLALVQSSRPIDAPDRPPGSVQVPGLPWFVTDGHRSARSTSMPRRVFSMALYSSEFLSIGLSSRCSIAAVASIK